LFPPLFCTDSQVFIFAMTHLTGGRKRTSTLTFLFSAIAWSTWPATRFSCFHAIVRSGPILHLLLPNPPSPIYSPKFESFHCRAGIRHHVENSVQSSNRVHRVSIFVATWGADASSRELHDCDFGGRRPQARALMLPLMPLLSHAQLHHFRMPFSNCISSYVFELGGTAPRQESRFFGFPQSVLQHHNR
jgi:hypothetical protein